MKTELKAKFIQHLNQKKQDQGFTLIELLVVIIIIGILSAIALPSFLNQANRARESEAKQYAGSMNRAQQAFYLEKQAFSTAIENLGLGIKTQTDNYKYEIAPGPNDAATAVSNLASSLKSGDSPTRHFTGGVNLGEVEGTGEATTIAILCQTIKAPVVQDGPDTAEPTNYGTAGPTCPGANWETIK